MLPLRVQRYGDDVKLQISRSERWVKRSIQRGLFGRQYSSITDPTSAEVVTSYSSNIVTRSIANNLTDI